MNKILIIDDDDIVRLALSKNLSAGGLSPIEAASGKEGVEIFQRELPSSVLLDLRMPGMDGLETLEELKKINSDVPVVILTAHGDISSAVQATKLGAYEFIIKPPDYDRLLLTLKRATEKYELDGKVKRLNNEVETSFEYLCGKSERMKKVIKQIHMISTSELSLIIQGETGTGKSFIARYIHNLSKRGKNRLVTVDIGSLPESLVESELFGYEKGAFTGAVHRKKGFFETADGGTIFMDELQNLSPYVQSKLLQAVDDKTIQPLGSTHPVETDVRIIGATNSDIMRAVRKKLFREDLFYRLGEFIIDLPPLRDRPEDIPFLAEKFFREFAEDMDKQINSITDDAVGMLVNYSWPGNIRELKNVIRRAVFFADKGTISSDHLNFLNKDTVTSLEDKNESIFNDLPCLSLEDGEKIIIRKALNETNGNKTKAASILKTSYVTLLRKIKQYNIK